MEMKNLDWFLYDYDVMNMMNQDMKAFFAVHLFLAKNKIFILRGAPPNFGDQN